MTLDKDARYQFRLPKSLLDVALEKARRDDLTLAQVLRRLLRTWVESDPPTETKEKRPEHK